MRSSSDQGTLQHERFPTFQLFLLALCRIAEPLALTSPVPYAYDLMKELIEGDKTNAAFYAGLFFASFSVMESLTGFFWGALSDRIGRKPVLLLGSGGTIVSVLVVGLAPNVWVAVLGRALGGALNGNVGVEQTVVAELVRNPDHEPRAYAIMPFVWSLGCTIGPAVGGFLARPVEAFPRVFGASIIFAKYPYLLPNLVCAAMLAATMPLNCLFLDETHPQKRRKRRSRETSHENRHFEEAEAPLLSPTSRETRYDAPPNIIPKPKSPPAPSVKDIPANVWILILSICILNVHTLSFFQNFPILLQTPRYDTIPRQRHWAGNGGLDMSLQDTGLIMLINGIVGLVIQALVFPLMTKLLGARPYFLLISVIYPFAYFILPYLAFLPRGVWLTVGIYAWLIVRNLFTIGAYPLILIFIKRATPSPLLLGRVNGLVVSLTAGCRTLSPPVAGFLQNLGEKYGVSALAWWGFGVEALLGTLVAWLTKLPKS